MKIAVMLLFTARLFAQLPDPAALLEEVKANQHKLDEIRDNYTFHVFRQTDQLDKDGKVIKSSSIEREVFFINGRRIARLVKKDDVPLSPSEDKAEQARVRGKWRSR